MSSSEIKHEYAEGQIPSRNTYYGTCSCGWRGREISGWFWAKDDWGRHLQAVSGSAEWERKRRRDEEDHEAWLAFARMIRERHRKK